MTFGDCCWFNVGAARKKSHNLDVIDQDSEPDFALPIMLNQPPSHRAKDLESDAVTDYC